MIRIFNAACAALALLIAVSSLTAQVAAPAEVQSDRDTRLRIVSWNMLNLFDNYDEPNKPDEGTDPKSFAEIRHLAKAIDEMDADVLGVQEVENRAILEALNAHLKRPFAYVELVEGNDARGIDVGILSRVPVLRTASHRMMDLGNEHRFSRDFPLFRLAVAKGRVMEFGVMHLKSKRGKPEVSDAWRRAEADGIAKIVQRQRKLEPQVPVIIMGDFNDTRSSKPLESLFATMEDLTKSVDDKEKYTFTHRDQREQIDFILGAGTPKVASASIPKRADSPSDHHPVVVELALDAKINRVESPVGSGVATPKRPRIQARDLQAARRNLLQEVEIEGKVTKVHRHRSGAAVLNFHEDYRKAMTAYIPREAVARLGDLDKLVGKKVLVRGPISKRRSVYQIRLTRKSQLGNL